MYVRATYVHAALNELLRPIRRRKRLKYMQSSGLFVQSADKTKQKLVRIICTKRAGRPNSGSNKNGLHVWRVCASMLCVLCRAYMCLCVAHAALTRTTCVGKGLKVDQGLQCLFQRREKCYPHQARKAHLGLATRDDRETPTN